MKDIFASAFSSHQWPVPTVPPDGLFLNRLYFEGYNKKAAKVTERVKNLDRRSLSYDEPELVECLDAFKRQYIHSHIAQRIVLYRPFDAWIRTISSHWMPLPHGTPLEDVKIIGGERARERERQEKKRARQSEGRQHSAEREVGPAGTRRRDTDAYRVEDMGKWGKWGTRAAAYRSRRRRREREAQEQEASIVLPQRRQRSKRAPCAQFAQLARMISGTVKVSPIKNGPFI